MPPAGRNDSWRESAAGPASGDEPSQSFLCRSFLGAFPSLPNEKEFLQPEGATNFDESFPLRGSLFHEIPHLTSVLHSWGSAMTHHSHIHMIVLGGGLSPDGNRWVACKRGFFLPVRVLSRLFRHLFLDGLMALQQAGELAFFDDLKHLARADAFTASLAPFRKSEWVVYSKPPFNGPEAVLAYFSRYTHRVAISNHRLVSRRRRHGGVSLEGLPRQERRSPEGYARGDAGVHPTLPDARPARRVPPHPALRPTGQRGPQNKPRQMPCVALRPGPGTGECARSGARGRPAHAT